MKSLTQLFRIGVGPSSSHTMGPLRACQEIDSRHPDATYQVTLYGSLALTGRGHGTDAVIGRFWGDRVKVSFDPKTPVPHPNTMDVVAHTAEGDKTYRTFSVGGGAYRIEGEPFHEPHEVYPQRNFAEIADYCHSKRLRLPDYVFEYEPEVKAHLEAVWQTMKQAVKEGLAAQGELPGGLHVKRKARVLMEQKLPVEPDEIKMNRLVCAYAYAVAEQNAAGGVIVTAPTCGSSGVLPAVLYYMQTRYRYSDAAIVRAIAAAGVVGNVVKTNASISGAECGCQAEIGTACSMAAAALAELYNLSLEQISTAAEIAMEHHLGLTCDPVKGLVQIPCIERNGVAATRAFNALALATFLYSASQISFDEVVVTMYETGKDLGSSYRETAIGGLAKLK